MAASLSPVLHPFPWIDCVIIFGLVALNGVFAMSELAIVSARRPRLDAMARKGSKGAARAMALGADPGRFLSTVQIGITLIGIIAGAYSGASLGGPTGERLAVLGVREDWAETLGFAIVIGITTFVSLVIGELVPKQFALRAPEPIAAVMALPMQWLARITAPFVWLLDNTSALIFRILRLKRETQSHVTAEELHLIVAEASKSGVIEESERAIISGVVRLADRPVREVMTPRTEVAWVDVDASPQDLHDAILESGHSRLLIAEGSVDKVIGVVQSRDIVAALLNRLPLDMRALMRTAPIVPDQVDAMDALGVLRGAEVPMALVHDEYGHFEGIVTPVDLLVAIAGGFASDADDDGEPALVEREDGSLLVAGWMAADSLAERLGLTLPEDRDYATAAGFVLETLKHIPETGEWFEAQGWRFEVIDMDGRKIDKLLVSSTR
ncbi:hemolysin family protein [Aquisediminimonas profunda]|uniref:hemolysin family protein n=1 Tax=Aquisediminimonas profunda TaxID=1550733 RepID=UPI001C636C03|nr:hemolysin family protein [Aquisediminimonas profunda]